MMDWLMQLPEWLNRQLATIKGSRNRGQHAIQFTSHLRNGYPARPINAGRGSWLVMQFFGKSQFLIDHSPQIPGLQHFCFP
ncbi:MAG: hypothetical protein WBP54_03205 [Pelodictyon phaeoclathratiforme]